MKPCVLLTLLLLLASACAEPPSPPEGPGPVDGGTTNPDAGNPGTNPDAGNPGTDGGTQPGTDGGTGGGDGGTPPVGGTDRNVVTYAGGTGHERFYDVLVLSNGTVLVAGGAQSLDWLPASVPRTELPASGINSASAGNIGFILHLSADLRTVLRVVHFPVGLVRDIRRLRTTSLPGQPTGDIYLSGTRDVSDYMQDGYFIARLRGNFVTAPPSGLEWAYDVQCRPRRASGFTGEADHKALQPWDVGSDGKVVYAMGAEYDFDWAAIERLDASGQREVVPEWPAHWTATTEYTGRAADYSGASGPLVRSAIVMKAGRRGSLRSTSQADYEALLPDGNGRTDRKGRLPDDYYFTGPCLPSPGTCSGSGPGYTGYRTSDKPTQRVGGIVIDRRNNHIYFGYSTQSRLPDGNPDFEPAVVAMDSQGRLLWWSRLYPERRERTGGGFDTTSPPDQYVDHIALDHAGNRLVVLARAHGNNVLNFWNGHQVAARPGASSFHNQFTGTNGNIHLSWLGKLELSSGALYAASWVAEYSEGTGSLGAPYPEPIHDGWPNHNAGWPNLNTTRVSHLEVDAEGAVYLVAEGRRTITTSNAYMKMPRPSTSNPSGPPRSGWNHFVRVFEPDLSRLRYSSILRGPWDPEQDGGGANVRLEGVFPVSGGVIAVGYHLVDAQGAPLGVPIPLASVPEWGSSAPAGESGVLAHLRIVPP